eukprot:923982_1
MRRKRRRDETNDLHDNTITQPPRKRMKRMKQATITSYKLKKITRDERAEIAQKVRKNIEAKKKKINDHVSYINAIDNINTGYRLKRKSIDIIWWNTEGACRRSDTRNTDLLASIDTYNADMFIANEMMGFKGKDRGYRTYDEEERMKWIPNPFQMHLASRNETLICGTFIRNNIKSVIPIALPENIFINIPLKNRIHADLCAIYLDEQIRNREYIIFINIYRSPSITAV